MASDIDAVALGERLRGLRAERGLTLGQVAGDRFSAAFLSQIERGLARPSTPNLCHIAERLGVDAELILRTTPSEGDRELASLRLTEARGALAREDAETTLECLASLPATLTASDRCEAALLRGDALIKVEREDDALAVVDGIRDEPRAAVADTQVRLAEVAARAHYRKLRYHQALEELRAAEPLIDDAGVDPMARARFFTLRAAVRVMIGDERRAIADYHAALEAGGNLADLLELGRIYDGLNRAHQLLGNYDEALEYARRSAQVFEVLQNGRHVGRVHDSLGNLHLRLGDLAEAERSFTRALAAFRAVHDLSSEAHTLRNVSEVAVRRGDLDRAEERAAEATRLAEAADNAVVAADVALLRGEIAQTRGDLDAAERYLEAAVAGFEAAGIGRRLGEACHALAKVLHRKKDDRRAFLYANRAFEAHHDSDGSPGL